MDTPESSLFRINNHHSVLYHLFVCFLTIISISKRDTGPNAYRPQSSILYTVKKLNTLRNLEFEKGNFHKELNYFFQVLIAA